MSLFNLRYVAIVCGIAFLASGIGSAQTTNGKLANGTEKAVDSANYVNQAGVSSPENPPDPKLTLSPLEILRKFEPSKDEEYTLGPGDELSIQYPGRPELASKSVVGPDGRITLPLAGPFEVANLTREAAAAKIGVALSAY